MLGRLRDPEQVARIRREMEAANQGRGGWDQVFISSTVLPEQKQWEGRNVAEIAAAKQTDPLSVVFELLLGGKYVGMIRFGMSEDDVRTVMRHPLVMVGSDGSCLAPYGPLGSGKPHPRNYGTFVRVLGKYVREERVLDLAEGLRKMTSLPASRMRLSDRGLLRPGLAADITVFDPATVGERATFADPHRYAAGIAAVVVNGRLTVADGEHLGVLGGRVLVRGRA
jgi:N-acyl-D-amino-acid deacylase